MNTLEQEKESSTPERIALEKRRSESRGFLLCLATVIAVAGTGLQQWFNDHKAPTDAMSRAVQSDSVVSVPIAETRAPLSAKSPVSVTAVVDTHKVHQRWEGFGASTAYYQDWIAGHPNKKKIYAALFKELNLEFLRLRNVYQPGAKGNFAPADVNIVQGAQAARGRPVTLMMASWSPPALLKSNKSLKNGGTLTRTNSGFDYTGFAQYWKESLLAYRRIGIKPAWVSIQNEPDWKAEWESCLFQPEEEDGSLATYGLALSAVEKTLRTLPDPPLLLGPETLGIGGGNPERYLPPSNATRLARVGAVAHHLYSGGTQDNPDSFIPRLHALREAYPNKLRFQTEFGRSDGFETAWLIHNTVVEEEAHAYVYWAAAWPDADCLLTLDNPWKPGEWKYPEGFARTDRFFALKHYSAFIEKGAVRVESHANNAALRVSAFLSPDRSQLIVVALNTDADESMRFSVETPGWTGDKSVVGYRTCQETGEKFRRLPAESVEGAWTLPPRAIITLVLEARK